MFEDASLRQSVIEYCAKIGADSLLVQGAGGNVSWKEEGTLWIKASGTWLADAKEKDIFLPVDLQHLQQAFQRGEFNIAPQLIGVHLLRPSIETLLHALLPHKVVVHLHAVEVLARLVRENCKAELQSLLDKSVSWTMVDYFKPGEALAIAINEALLAAPSADVVFLKNHGVVIGGADIFAINETLKKLTESLYTDSVAKMIPLPLPRQLGEQIQEKYIPVSDLGTNQLALNKELFDRLSSDWALYPDHVVFLGARAYAYKSWVDFAHAYAKIENFPELVIIENEGVFVAPTFNKAKFSQLRCYYDVLSRQAPLTVTASLDGEQIAELLDWDAEKYRISIAN